MYCFTSSRYRKLNYIINYNSINITYQKCQKIKINLNHLRFLSQLLLLHLSSLLNQLFLLHLISNLLKILSRHRTLHLLIPFKVVWVVKYLINPQLHKCSEDLKEVQAVEAVQKNINSCLQVYQWWDLKLKTLWCKQLLIRK